MASRENNPGDPGQSPGTLRLPRQALGSLCRGLGRTAGPLISYEVLLKILQAALLGPFSAWVLGAMISATGSVAVSNEQILSFACSPLGVVTLLVSLTLGSLITLLEQSGLIRIAAAAYAGRPASSLAALWHALRNSLRLLVLALLQILMYAALLVPFLAVAGGAYLAWLSEHDINYYLAERPPIFWRALGVGGAAVAGAAVLAAWLYVRLLFALPACVLANQRPWASLRLSFQLTRGVALRLAGYVLVWLVAVGLVGGVLGGLLQLAERLAIGLAGQQLAALIPTLAGLVLLNLLTGALLSLLTMTTHALLVVWLYRQATKGHPGPRPEPAPALPDAAGMPGWLSRKRLVFAAAMALLVAMAAVSALLLEQIGIQDRVAVTAHRGSSRSAPENTISAVEAAIAQGADFAEIDVQQTADGTIVVLHDSDLMRVARLNKKIWEVEYAEIASLDAGSWFSEDFRGERIPTLQQTIDAARGRIRLNIELKLSGPDQRLVEGVLRLVRENGFHGECVLSSLSSEAVLKAKALERRVRVGHIVSVALGEVSKLDVDFLSVHEKQVTAGLVRRLHRAGKQVHAWTVNDRRRMSALIDLGVDNIITDEPRTVREVLAERAEMSNAERILLGARDWLAR